MAERITVNSKKPVSIKENLISHKRKTGFRSNSLPVNRILYLQRTIGNQAVQRMVRSGVLQAKLRIGQPGDKYEQEADRVADAVMRMPEPGVQRQKEPEEEEEMLQAKPLAGQITPLVQRQVEPEEEEEEEMLQAKGREDATSEVSNDLESQINAIKSGGHPLPESTRSFFEPRFGRDFSQVRVHTDTRAAEAAGAVNARAFTVGQDVVFGTGQYEYGTTAGRKLLAHELIHTVQQGNNVTKINFKKFRNIIGRGRSFQIIQREVGGDITQMSITEQFARDLTDGELWEQIQIIRDQLTTFGPSSSEFDVARSNLQILEQEVGRRNVPTYITNIYVDLSTQFVWWVYSDGTTSALHETSTGTGICQNDRSVCYSGNTPETGCTPVGGPFPVTGNRPHRNYRYFIDFGRPSIGFHEYSKVDGCPWSHGCVRLRRNAIDLLNSGVVTESQAGTRPGVTATQVWVNGQPNIIRCWTTANGGHCYIRNATGKGRTGQRCAKNDCFPMGDFPIPDMSDQATRYA